MGKWMKASTANALIKLVAKVPIGIIPIAVLGLVNQSVLFFSLYKNLLVEILM